MEFCIVHKKGEASRIDDNSRFYNDMTEEKFTKIINNLNGKFHLLKTWESNQYKSSTKFINFILRREKYD